MSPWNPLRLFVTAFLTLIFGVVASAGRAQPNSAGLAALPDTPQVLNTAAGRIRVVPIKGLVYPWALAFLPSGDMLVTEQGRSTLRLIHEGVLDPTPITGLPPGITSQRRDTAGVDIAVHPNFSLNRFVYVAYWKPQAGPDGIRTAVLVRGRLEDHQLKDVREIFESVSWTDGPSAARIIFGPDGKIYMAIGAPGFKESLGETSWAQDPAHHGGKILRLNDDGTVPADNPFVGQSAYRPEIYAVGVRNAIGMAFHPQTGELWETENGPQGGDEINVILPGANYGWPVVTYGRAYSTDPDGSRSGLPPPTIQPPTAAVDMEEPFTYYKPSIAISGMTFYTGDQFPQWRGDLFAGGLVGMQLSRVMFTPQGLERRRETLLSELRQRIRDVKQGPDGFLYLTTDMQDGAVLRIEPAHEGVQQPDAVDTHRAAARTAAGDDHLALLETVCRVPRPVPASATAARRPPRVVPPREEWQTEPAQVFDNLYFVGTQQHGAWAVTTSEGIIVIDALYDYAVEGAVVEGLRKVGLDPADITHVVISHGHGDHHGGAKYLQDHFGAQILMGASDWDLVERSTRDPVPRRDVVATDEMQIRLGETTVTLYLTPGHTAGTVSSMIEVRDGGRSHLTASWGGTSLFATTTIESIQAYIDSAVRYQALIERRGADVLIANHTSFDRTPEKLLALADRRTGDPHPYVIGTEAVQRYVKVAEECARAELARRMAQ